MQSHGIVQHIFDNICYYMFHMYVLIYLMDISMRKSMLHWSRKHTVHWSISGGVTVAKARAGVHLPATGVSTTLLSFFKRTHHYVSIYSSANRCVNDGAGGDAPRFSPSSRQHRQTGWAGFKTKERVVFFTLMSASPAGMIRNPRHLPPSPVNPTMEYI